MSGLNRASADVLLRPRVEGFDLFNFHTQVDDLANRGRESMLQALPALEERLYGEAGAIPMGVSQWRIVGDAPPGLAALADSCLPPGEPWRRRDGYRLLRRALAQGLVAEIWLVLTPDISPVMEIHVQPNPVIASVLWDLPADWQEESLRLAAQHGLAPGQPFCEPAWGSFLQELLIHGSLRGRPLLDLSGCSFTANGELRIVVREALVASTEVNVSELRPASKRVMDTLIWPMVGKPLDTSVLANRLLEMDQSLNLQNPEARLQVGADGSEWILGLNASDRHRVQVNVAAAYETTWGLHGVLDAWLKDFLIKGNEWWLHAYGDKIQQGASISLRHALLAQPTTGYFFGTRYLRHRFEGDPLLGYFGSAVDAGGYQRLIENSSQRTSDAFAGLFQRFGKDRRGLVEFEYQHREATLAPDGPPRVKNSEDTVSLSTEWDCFDRSFFPTEGLQIRARGTAGRTQTRIQVTPAPEPAWEQIRSAYFLCRALTKDVIGPVSADIALEAGMGWRTTLVPDRQYILGGDASLIGTPSTRFLAPNFAILRAGLPIALRREFGGHIQVVPRLDFGRFSQDPNNLTAGMRVLGQGVVVRGAVGKFYIETGWGMIQVRPFFPGPMRRESQFNVLVGARPFDLWTRN
jgi:hypothetical protein